MHFRGGLAILLASGLLVSSCTTALPTATAVPARVPSATTAPTPSRTPTATRAPTPTVAPTATRTPTPVPSATPTLVLPSRCPQGCTTHVQGCDIKANISDKGEKIYHTFHSQSYTRTVITADKGERWFCNEVEAKAAGWRPSAD